MHTREQIFRDAAVAPLKEGTFTILGTLICEEVDSEESFKVSVEVTPGTISDLRSSLLSRIAG